jgi:hypothetical protein
MAFDRYSSICRFNNWNLKAASLSIIVVWFLSFVFAMPQTFLFKIQEYNVTENYSISSCLINWDNNKLHEITYILYVALVQFFIPCLMLVYFYSKVFLKISKYSRLKRSENSLYASSTTQDHMMDSNTNIYRCKVEERNFFIQKNSKRLIKKNYISDTKLKALKLTLVIVITFIFCSIPFYTGVLANVIFGEYLNKKIDFMKVLLNCK